MTDHNDSDWIGTGKGQVLSMSPGSMTFEAWEKAEQPNPLYPTELTPEQLSVRKEVDEVLERLAPKYRELIREYFWERLTLEEMAQERGITRQAVHQQLQTALKKFRREIFRLGG